jgi:tRNA (mo5U34)-methyltransferase
VSRTECIPANGTAVADWTPHKISAANGPVVVDALPREARDQLVQSYEKWFQAGNTGALGAQGNAEAASVVERAAQERRQQLLAALPLGDLSEKTCVDFGVGCRGFASSFPRLQKCARAIGIDLSYEAIKASAAVSEWGGFPYGRNYTYLTSRGDRIDLADGSVDVVYAGDSLECVENPDAFLDEVHRILKPGGQFALTTVNAEAYLYRAHNETYGVCPQHLAPLGYAELRRLLDARFEVLAAHGYNRSTARAWDEKIQDLEYARAAAAQYAEHPSLTTGVVVLARKRADYRPFAYTQRRFPHDSPHTYYRGGPWEVIGLFGLMTGRSVSGGDNAALALAFEGTGIIVHFWTHPWSGDAIVEIDGVPQAVNLYSPVSGFKRVHVGGLPPGPHHLRVTGSQNLDPRSHGNQVIFYQAIAYERHERGPAADGREARGLPAPAAPAAEELRRKVASREWFHTIDLGHGVVTPGCDNSSAKLGYLNLPERLDGLAVLDIGAYDGYYSFACERRGARRVVAADHFCWCYGGMATKDGFDIAKAALRSKVEDVFIPVEEISPERVGTFDLVLFLGVLYHSQDPMRYLRIVRSVCRGQLVLETEVDALDYPRPAAVFYPGSTLNNDASNFWGPNPAAVEAMLKEVGFSRVERVCTFNMVHRPGRAFHRIVYHAFV